MYTNILTEEGLATIEKYLYTFKEECYKLTPLGDSFNIPMILALLKIVMTTNVFMFGDTWWLQQMGTAMGTPVACIYATLFFAYFERTTIIPKYVQIKFIILRKTDRRHPYNLASHRT